MTYIQPVLSFLFCLLLIAVLLHSRKAKNWLLVLGLAGLFFWSWTPFAKLDTDSLEGWFPVQEEPQGDVQAIVVLSGYVSPPDISQPEPLAGHDTYIRCQHAAWLYKHWKQVPIVASGGPTFEHVVLSRVMKQVLEEAGIPSGMIWTEERSTNTYENALYTANLLRSKGIQKIALVTEAYHMLRADLCFRKQGFIPVPAPCNYRTLVKLQWRSMFPDPGAIEWNEDCLHEWVGLAWYKLSGKI